MWLQICVVSLLGLSVSASEQVLGCGGFIRASRSLDFSRVNVQLFSKQGSLKYETDCAPNNGYFYVPVYEKGEYVLKVSPPLGWKFSPNSVSLDINGVSDPCSSNKDILFEFQGFGVVGRLIVDGSETAGPPGVTINLVSGEDSQVVQTTFTDNKGNFVFPAVPGTDHRVEASHPTWKFSKGEAVVSMTGDNAQAEDLVLAGFDVSGSVVSGGEAMQGVNLLLFGKPGSFLEYCEDNEKSDAPAPEGLTQLCRVKTGKGGEFIFPVVTPGDYVLVPFFKGELTQYEVTPSALPINVKSDSFKIEEPFQVAGFSVQGQVFSSPSNGVSDIEVILTSSSGDVIKTSTSEDGKYYLDKVQADTYDLSAVGVGMEFPTLSIEVSPKKPVLPELIASKFLVSGQLDFSSAVQDSARRVVFTSQTLASVSIPTDEAGKFSVLLPPAIYSVSVKATSVDEQMGIVFAPLSLDVKVHDKPVSNLYFSPVRVTVSGTIRCLEAHGSSTCPDLTVNLKPEGFGQPMSRVAKNGRFNFDNQLPGSYMVTIDQTAGLCWANHAISFNIESEPVDKLQFQQTGWMMEVLSSHETVLVYSGEGSGELDIPIGQSVHCLPSPGPYNLVPESCHIFQAKEFSWEANGSPVKLKALKHLVSGRISSVEDISDLELSITTTGEMKALALTTPEEKDGLLYYNFGIQASPHEELALEPKAGKFLITPPRLTVLVADDCQLDSVVFTATRGLFVSGQIYPPLEGVEITLSSNQLPSSMTLLTDDQGSYSVGPFPKDLKYSVKAEKLGYVISEVEGQPGNFNAKKLASVVVKVVDGNGNGLPGVVVSLSGGEENYRTNELTGEGGSLSFLALSPGEYFVKPVLKEFEFTPKSKLISVTEGAEEVVTVVGKRVAFSVFGILTGLKGDPEPGVVLEAVGLGEDCQMYQEEATSGSDGKFRIRGLQPACDYDLRLKKSKGNVMIVERTIPTFRRINVVDGDVKGIELIAMRPKTSMDVSLLIKVKKADTIKNLKAKLFCGDNDSPIHTVKMDSQKFYIFPSIPIDGSDCHISVEASAVQANQKVKAGRINFVADKPIEHHLLEMELEPVIGRGDIGQASWLTLPFVILLVTVVLQWKQISPCLAEFASSVERYVLTKKSGTSAGMGARQRADIGGGGGGVGMTEEELNKTVKFVEASTKKRIKPKNQSKVNHSP